MTYFPLKARSECVAPADDVLGGVVEIMRMFHAACAASQRPGARPTRGSGFGGVAETIGVTGGGITAGGGGGGTGRAPPRAPARPALGSPAGGVDGRAAGCCASRVSFSTNNATTRSMAVITSDRTFFIRA